MARNPKDSANGKFPKVGLVLDH